MNNSAIAVNGILLLDKPLHMTSNRVLQRVKRLFGAKKAGHTGSLDPLATGMLPICFGEATKISQFLLEADKYYQVEAKLGITTTTGDAEGAILSTRPVEGVTRARVETVLQQFKGTIEQIPPMFSAVKQNGKPLYQLARQGIAVPRQARTIQVHQLDLIEFNGDRFRLTVHCTKGTYVRTLVEDIGEALGCGAFVSALHRTAVAPYQSGTMVSLDVLEEQHRQSGMERLRQHYLMPIDTSLAGYPAVIVSPSAAFYLRRGQSIMVSCSLDRGYVRMQEEDGRLIGIGEVVAEGRVAPKRLLHLTEQE